MRFEKKTTLVFGSVVAVMFALTIGRCAINVGGRSHDIASAGAARWIREIGIDAKATCASIDSDNDGYVSCSMVVTSPDGTKRIEALECADSLTLNSGCRVPKAVVRGW